MLTFSDNLEERAMPSRMLTAKQGRFAQLVARGESLSSAYRGAYDTSRMAPSSIHVNASKLAANAKVALRIAELRRGAAEYAVLDVVSVLEEFATLRDAALAKGHLRIALRAIERRAELAGVYPCRDRATLG
jgi:hypothetical protein